LCLCFGKWLRQFQRTASTVITQHAKFIAIFALIGGEFRQPIQL